MARDKVRGLRSFCTSLPSTAAQVRDLLFERPGRGGFARRASCSGEGARGQPSRVGRGSRGVGSALGGPWRPSSWLSRRVSWWRSTARSLTGADDAELEAGVDVPTVLEKLMVQRGEIEQAAREREEAAQEALASLQQLFRDLTRLSNPEAELGSPHYVDLWIHPELLLNYKSV